MQKEEQLRSYVRSGREAANPKTNPHEDIRSGRPGTMGPGVDHIGWRLKSLSTLIGPRYNLLEGDGFGVVGATTCILRSPVLTNHSHEQAGSTLLAMTRIMNNGLLSMTRKKLHAGMHTDCETSVVFDAAVTSSVSTPGVCPQASRSLKLPGASCRSPT